MIAKIDSPIELELSHSHLDRSADLNAFHTADLKDRSWFPHTWEIFFVNFKLSPCARLLYEWFRLKSPPGVMFKARLQDFQALMKEHDTRRDKPYSMRQIRRAVSELQELELIDIKHDEMHLSTREVGKLQPQNTSRKSAPKEKTLISKPGHYCQDQDINVQPQTLMSNQEAESIGKSSLSGSLDLNDLNDLSISKRESEQKENFKEEINSQESNFKAREKEVKSSKPKANLEDQPSAAAAVAPKVHRDRTAERYNRPPGKLDWEIEPGVAYPAFVEWRAQHYRKQGGHLADAAIANAKSEIRKNPARADDLWQQFLSYSNQAADNALAAKEAGMKGEMPPCFSETAPASKEELFKKLEAVNNSTALSPAPETATSPKAIAPSVIRFDNSRVLPVVTAAQFEVERSEIPDFIREKLERLSAKRTMPRQSTEAAKRAEIDVAQVERQLKGQLDPIDEWF